MPTYDYYCTECGEEFERMLSISRRREPTEQPCPSSTCDGHVSIKVSVPGFAYDNISSPGHKKATPGWMKDKLKEIKRTQPKATMNIPE